MGKTRLWNKFFVLTARLNERTQLEWYRPAEVSLQSVKYFILGTLNRVHVVDPATFCIGVGRAKESRMEKTGTRLIRFFSKYAAT